MKIDGHTHTHYCPHGSGEETAKYIEKAIELDFDVYVLTEHPPLPASFRNQLPYSEELISSLAMKEADLDSYIKEMHKLKQKYKDRIQIRVGLELDYLPEHLDWTRYLLKEYDGYLDETILSVHFLKGVNGWRCVDLTPEDYKEGLIEYYGDFHSVQKVYYQTLQEAICTFHPTRVGHLTLCQKFQHYFANGLYIPEETRKQILSILSIIKQQGCSLDFNTAGLYKKYCLEPYPSSWIVQKACEWEIPLIFGSDAHAVDQVGRSYDIYLKQCIKAAPKR
ncbi:histidinol-phosphatase HisJ [Thermoflavimicrobium dichotomicum]|uniref:Histidinol-phosphatase n=1 Tax=Thermoflavimicrobium dichotomicum TaxID=46223 RepID=A0A1I3TEG4_9BACL|nr:histidinol-phosphatase HisJ [Thermoflavimicrobium dichotomicum]SFJ69564.1 histidinol-phosphatase (PHP family) [Thermoflavimicrobium dichotomicum]